MVEKLSEQEVKEKLKGLNKEWQNKNNHLLKKFKLDDFKTALLITVKIGGIAESQNHHPKITLSWGEVVVELWTHEAGGLTEKDFSLASSIDAINLGDNLKIN